MTPINKKALLHAARTVVGPILKVFEQLPNLDFLDTSVCTKIYQDDLLTGWFELASA